LYGIEKAQWKLAATNFLLPRREINEEHIRQDIDIGSFVVVNQPGIANRNREAGWKSFSVPASTVPTALRTITLVTNPNVDTAWKSLFSSWLGDML